MATYSTTLPVYTCKKKNVPGTQHSKWAPSFYSPLTLSKPHQEHTHKHIPGIHCKSPFTHGISGPAPTPNILVTAALELLSLDHMRQEDPVYRGNQPTQHRQQGVLRVWQSIIITIIVQGIGLYVLRRRTCRRALVFARQPSPSRDS